MSGRQHIIPIRRAYNRLVADETLEDYACASPPRRARRWSAFQVAQTALGSLSFLALEAIGGTLVLATGFSNTLAAVLVVGVLIFATAAPITIYAARYGLDMDLLTRGAGFGYLGSTVTSLIYASFTFLFFAIEAAIMALALQLCFGLPLWIGYLACAAVVIPLVAYGIRLISRFQIGTQPFWIGLNLLPLACIAWKGDAPLDALFAFPGLAPGSGAGFDAARFGARRRRASGLAGAGRRAGRLPAVRAGARRAARPALVGGGAGGRRRLDRAGDAQDPARRLPGGAGDGARRRPGERRRADPDVLDRLRLRHAFAGGGARPDDRLRRGLAAQDQPHQRLCRLDRVVELLLAPDAQPSGAGGVARLQRGDRAAADGARHRQDHRQHAAALRGRGLGLGRALASDLAINKPLGLSPPGIEFKRAHLYAINPVGHRRDDAGAARRHPRPCGAARARAAALRAAADARRRVRGGAADRLGHGRALLPGAGAEGGLGAA